MRLDRPRAPPYSQPKSPLRAPNLLPHTPQGGFAKCYALRRLDTDRVYAGKVVGKSSLVKSRAKQKLLAEIKIHRDLKHRHVVKFEHYFEDKHNVYILLELCHGQTLMELIKRRKRLTEREVRAYRMHIWSSSFK